MSIGIWLLMAFVIYALVLVALPIAAGALALRWSREHPAPPPGEIHSVSCKRCQQKYSSVETACPSCGQPQPSPSATLDVQSWSSRKRNLLATATVWPFVYMILFFGAILSIFASIASDVFPFWLFACVFPLHFITIFLTLGLLVVYIMLVVNSTEFDSSQRTMWIVALILGGWIAQLVAYIVFVWRPWVAAHPAPTAPGTQPPAPGPPHDPLPPVG